jgi:hypothetical protein
MSAPPRPCSHCGSATFHFLPQVRLPFEVATTLLGVTASKRIKGTFWEFTLVVCAQCGLSQMFTNNAPQVAQHVPGANTSTVPVR